MSDDHNKDGDSKAGGGENAAAPPPVNEPVSEPLKEPGSVSAGDKLRVGARRAGDGAKAAGAATAKAARQVGRGLAADARNLGDEVKKLFGGGKRRTPHPEPEPGRDPRARGLYERAATRAKAEAAGDAAPDGAPGGESAVTARTAARRDRRPSWRNPWIVETASAGVSLALIGLIGFLFGAFVILAPRVDDNADLWSVNRPPSIVILDREGAEIASRGSRYGRAVSVDELPPYLIKAILSTEDRRFYEHAGVDIRGTLRALMVNLRSGSVVEGGSTITQQLARNLFLSAEQTYTRKAKEALLALWLEGRYTKDDILNLYLNRIYLGAGAYGVDAAAKTYFGKSARDVSLAEAVMIAGLPKAPSALAPTQNPFGAQTRANEVLDNLRENNEISEFEAREARLNPPVISGGANDVELGYFFDYVAAIARDFAERRSLSLGEDLIITTTIDQKMQKDAETAIASAIGVDTRLAGAEQAALIAYASDGAMRAMVGGRSYIESQFNRAVQAKRQPGSAFKPFVYTAALEAGMTTNSVFVDQPIDIDGWKPTNYTPGYQGRMRMTEAVSKSVNTIAVQVSERVGRQKVAAAAHRLGIRSDIEPVRSIALGGVNVSLDELTAAYLPFANNGLAPRPYAIERIEDQNLQVIYQRADRRPDRVLTEAVAADMTHLLYQVIHGGTGGRASLGARVAAGKTGTTNDWRDAWFIGYTAQITAGVWVGNDDFTPMDHITGGTLPAEIWRNFMLAAHQGMAQKTLPGAYPAPAFGDETQLLSFYADVARGLTTVRRDGDGRRAQRRR